MHWDLGSGDAPSYSRRLQARSLPPSFGKAAVLYSSKQSWRRCLSYQVDEQIEFIAQNLTVQLFSLFFFFCFAPKGVCLCLLGRVSQSGLMPLSLSCLKILCWRSQKVEKLSLKSVGLFWVIETESEQQLLEHCSVCLCAFARGGTARYCDFCLLLKGKQTNKKSLKTH